MTSYLFALYLKFSCNAPNLTVLFLQTVLFPSKMSSFPGIPLSATAASAFTGQFRFTPRRVTDAEFLFAALLSMNPRYATATPGDSQLRLSLAFGAQICGFICRC